MIFKITMKHLLSKPVSTMLTLVSLAAALTILGAFWTVVENLERVRIQAKSTDAPDTIPGLTIFADSRLNARELDTLKNKILADKSFKSAQVVSAADAVKALEAQFGEALSKVFGNEGLPVTIKLEFASSTMTRQELVNLLNSLRSIPGVLEVDDGGLMVAPVSDSAVTNRLFSWASMLLGTVFLVVALLVSHLIRLAFESLRSEIETMKVIGAPNRWILGPLVVDGLMMGLIGALMSLVALLGLVEFVLPRFAPYLLPKGVTVSGLSVSSTLALLGMGVGASLVGALGTWPLVRRRPQDI